MSPDFNQLFYYNVHSNVQKNCLQPLYPSPDPMYLVTIKVVSQLCIFPLTQQFQRRPEESFRH